MKNPHRSGRFRRHPRVAARVATLRAGRRHRPSSLKTNRLRRADRLRRTVIVAFKDGGAGLTDTHLRVLTANGITLGRKLPTLGMVAIKRDPPRKSTPSRKILRRSLYANDQLQWFMAEAPCSPASKKLQSDSTLTTANGGTPVFGNTDFSVVINDSGIDATHADLAFGSHVVQNVRCRGENTSKPVVSSTIARFARRASEREVACVASMPPVVDHDGKIRVAKTGVRRSRRERRVGLEVFFDAGWSTRASP